MWNKLLAMLFTELIGALIVALIILYIYYKFVIFNFWHKRGVFSIKPVVPIGNITDLITGKKQIDTFFQDIYKKYKNHRAIGIYTFYKPNLVLADLGLIRTVLTKEFGSFYDHGKYDNEKIDPLAAHLYFMCGRKWENMHVKLTPAFTSENIRQIFHMMTECGEDLAKYMEPIAQVKESIEIQDLMARYTTDIVMSTGFSIKSHCIEEPDNKYCIQGKKIFNLHPVWIALTLFMPQFMKFFSIPLTDRLFTKFYMDMFRENVKYRLTHHIVKQDFLNLLIQLMKTDYIGSDDEEKTDESSANVNNLTLKQAAAQSFSFFAGFVLTGKTTSFALCELAQHRDIQDKVREEIDETLAKHGGELTYDAVNEMTYLHKVVNETLRKFPPVPFLNRICTKKIKLSPTNIDLPKGTLITIPIFGVHRDPSIYPHPERFDPERFNPEVVAKRHPYAYLPFGEGPRICIAEQFGYMQIKIGLVCLLSKYKFQLWTQFPFQFDGADILTAKEGIYLTVEPR